MIRTACPFILCCLAGLAHGQSDDDAAALALSGTAPAATAHFGSVTFEGAATEFAQPGAEEQDRQRLSMDARLDASFMPGLRGVLAERIDSVWAGTVGGSQQVGTLKEAYIGWQPHADWLLDAGRINARQGVAYGYNPTDFFRVDAIRSLVSIDPNSLRENRLGTVMLRAQELWDSGSVTAAYAPRLTERTSTAALNPDWAATNSHGRWLLSLSQRLAPGWTPQWLAYGANGQSVQLGLDLTSGLGKSTVAYLEVAAGRSKSLLAQAMDLPGGESLRSRAAAGLTYSFANKLSLTVEYEYNGTGANANVWAALRSVDLAFYAPYRAYALSQQDLATQSNAFVYASWQDFIVRHLDLTAFVRVDLVDHSRLPYLEMRRHWNSVDIALRWQDVGGNATSDFGASTQKQTWQLLVDYYL